MRVGEVCGLRWNDFNDDFTKLHIDESLTDTRFENTPKTEHSIRWIPINETLSKEYKKRHKLLGVNATSETYVFINRCHNPYTSVLLGLKFKSLKEYVLATYNIDLGDITLHCFRHTFATRGVDNGANIKDLQALLGHANSRTLLDVYAHSDERRMRNAAINIFNSFEETRQAR